MHNLTYLNILVYLVYFILSDLFWVCAQQLHVPLIATRGTNKAF